MSSMSGGTAIKAITAKTLDRALEELLREEQRRPRRRAVRAGTGSGKTALFFQLVRRYAQTLDELNDETTPMLIVVEEAQGMTLLDIWTTLQHSFSSRQRFRELIDVLTPPEQVPAKAAVEQARRNAEARRHFLDEFPAVTSGEVADLVGSRSQNRAALAHGWRKQGRIFSVPVGREQRYPLFQFDLDTGQPKPQIARVLRPLREAGLGGWQLALWFTGALSSLADRRPVDLLDDEAERVIDEAEAVAEIPE